MIYGTNPLIDPVGFLAGSFLYMMATWDLSVLVNLVLVGSIITFPFILLGGCITKKAKAKMNYFTKTFLVTLAVVAIFFAVFGAWRAVGGLGFYQISALAGFVIGGTLFAYPLFLFCNYFKKKALRWQVPDKLNTFITCIVGNIVAWFIFWGIFLLWTLVPALS